MSYGLLVAAGSGARFGGLKQFQRVHGRPLLVHVLRAFERCASVVETVVVTGADRLDYVERLAAQARCRKVKWIVAGGEQRQDSVERGLRVLPNQGLVAIHDAVRPVLSASQLDRGFAVCRRARAAIYALPVSETVKEVAGDVVLRTVPRGGLVLAQTPQFFALDLIKTALANAARSGFRATDDAQLVERLGCAVTMMPGWPDNIKVTTRADLRLVDRLLVR